MTALAPTITNSKFSRSSSSLSCNDLAGSGVYDYGFRDYSPVAMRFTTIDPIKDRSNWYAYVGNDPINKIDLLGLKGMFDSGVVTVPVNVYVVQGTAAQKDNNVGRQIDVIQETFAPQGVNVEIEIQIKLIESTTKSGMDLTNIDDPNSLEGQTLIDANSGQEYPATSEWGGSMNLLVTDRVGTDSQLGLSTTNGLNTAIIEATGPDKLAAHELGHLFMFGDEGHSKKGSLMSLDKRGTFLNQDLVDAMNMDLDWQYGSDRFGQGSPIFGSSGGISNFSRFEMSNACSN